MTGGLYDVRTKHAFHYCKRRVSLKLGRHLMVVKTSNVQILDEDDTRDLIVVADYLLLQNLKTPATQECGL